MKRLNRKGFTLIELMAVIAILIIIMGIALPNITSSIERSKNKQKNTKIELIKSAAELYFDRHSTVDKIKGVKVSTLIEEKELSGIDIEDVCTSNDCCVKYSSGNYQLVDDTSDCSNAS